MERGQRERVLAAYRRWATSYDRLMRSTYHRVERAHSLRHLLAHLPAGDPGRLLDAGGGDGYWCHALLAEGLAREAVVLDVSPEMLDLARRRSERERRRVPAVVGDVAHLPFPDDAFDTTLCLGGVVSHLLDPAAAFRELARVTRAGGHLAVSVDSLAVGIRTARRARDPELLRAVIERRTAPVFHHAGFPFPVRFFDPDEFRGHLRAAGLEVLSLIGKPVFTRYVQPREVLSAPDAERRVRDEAPFLDDPGFLPHADQLEAVTRIR